MNFSGPTVEQISDISKIFGMIMHHGIRNNFDIGSSSISYLKVARGGYASSFKSFNVSENFEIDNSLRQNMSYSSRNST